MNSLSYLSNLFNKPKIVVSDQSLPTQDDSPLDSIESETIYLSARANEFGGKPIITISSTEPAHLRQLNSVSYPRSRTASEIPLPDSPLLQGTDEDWLESVDNLPITEAETELETTLGEAKLRMKLLERDSLNRVGKSFGLRITVKLFFVIRSLLQLLGFYHVPSESEQQKTSTDETELETESLEKLEKPPLILPSSRTSSFFPSRSTSPIPPPRPPRLTPKTLVLDLDETLIHSTSRPYTMVGKRGNGLKVRVVEVILDGRRTVYTVYKRPWVDFFLRKVSTWYTVIIFTASLPEYADPVIDWLDGGDGKGGLVGGRLFRSDCLQTNGAYVKDLSVVDSDLSKVCLVDNSPASYAINQANGIPIEGWINDPDDECLLDLLPFLDSLRFTSDVRRVLSLRGFANESAN